MLKELLEKDRVRFAPSFDSWEDAVRASCAPLIADGSIEESYVEAILECLHEYGPYIIITPGVAIPHAKANIRGVHACAISMLKVETPVAFEPGNPEKDAVLLFALAANDDDAHFSNMERLSRLLMDEAALAELMAARNLEDVRALAERVG